MNVTNQPTTLNRIETVGTRRYRLCIYWAYAPGAYPSREGGGFVYFVEDTGRGGFCYFHARADNGKRFESSDDALAAARRHAATVEASR